MKVEFTPFKPEPTWIEFVERNSLTLCLEQHQHHWSARIKEVSVYDSPEGEPALCHSVNGATACEAVTAYLKHVQNRALVVRRPKGSSVLTFAFSSPICGVEDVLNKEVFYPQEYLD